ncbi:hypothetical protein PoB_007344200 [Plakobranchus ocellatus]|uniref:Uncharacterized protein n=1 Tax=Plakobranchus ocellatus TaxID=259542 RepID=A0AAV4DRJ9_9GAST|nr:hypothetical protein PoB_007344200 [Plakobranchus ocellatus]
MSDTHPPYMFNTFKGSEIGVRQDGSDGGSDIAGSKLSGFPSIKGREGGQARVAPPAHIPTIINLSMETYFLRSVLTKIWPHIALTNSCASVRPSLNMATHRSNQQFCQSQAFTQYGHKSLSPTVLPASGLHSIWPHIALTKSSVSVRPSFSMATHRSNQQFCKRQAFTQYGHTSL